MLPNFAFRVVVAASSWPRRRAPRTHFVDKVSSLATETDANDDLICKGRSRVNPNLNVDEPHHVRVRETKLDYGAFAQPRVVRLAWKGHSVILRTQL